MCKGYGIILDQINSHDDLETLSFLAQKVFNRNFDVFKGNVTCAGSNRVGSLDGLNLQAVWLFYQKHRNTLGSTNSNAKVVTEDSCRKELNMRKNENG